MLPGYPAAAGSRRLLYSSCHCSASYDRHRLEALMQHPSFYRKAALAGGATIAVAAAMLSGAASASAAPMRPAASAAPAAATTLTPNFDFLTGFLGAEGSPNTPPPGANNASCQLTAAHPFPVILVHGTFENQNDNWQAASPELVNHGFCVFAFNYGGSTATNDIQGTGEIAASAAQLSTEVNQVLAETGASKVDLVGHSQGGMMPRYYINFLGGASKVDKLVALAPSNFGTTLDGLVTLGQDLGLTSAVNGVLSGSCESCVEQEQGSAFLANLNATPTVPGVQYTVIESEDDEVVTPFTNAFLPAASNVTNITVQNQCSQDASDHLELAADPIAMADMLNALDPQSPVTVPCLTVEPLIGPIGTVPSF
jgi:triacylglycerol esterase/lipase EstA (alpha/beta hydrolase family)